MRPQKIVDPAGKQRCLHRPHPGTATHLRPSIQFVPPRGDPSFIQNPAITRFDAEADGFLVNVESDIVQTAHSYPPSVASLTDVLTDRQHFLYEPIHSNKILQGPIEAVRW